MAHVVIVRYHGPGPDVDEGVRYIAHREERLPGGRGRELMGLGERFKQAHGNEATIIDRLRQDARGLADARYYRIRLTLKDAANRRVRELPPARIEAVLGRAIEASTARRGWQGVYVLHSHGGRNRPAGHHHGHVHLSPITRFGPVTRISRTALADLKTTWAEEVDRSIARENVPQRAVEQALQRDSLGTYLRRAKRERERQQPAPVRAPSIR